jgi:aminoglycoside phosphotransferase (APT) family kinase protein
MIATAVTNGDRHDLLLAMPPERSISWAVRELGGGKLVSIEPLRGGVSHANHLLIVAGRNGIQSGVLRRGVRPEWAVEDPGFSAEQEIATYGLLVGSAVPAPRLIAADPAADGCDVPAILLSRAPGRRRVRPRDMSSFVGGLAAALPPVHSVDRSRAERTVPGYRHYYELDELILPAWWSRPEIWNRAVILAAEPPSIRSNAFIHRDYHQGNTLWRGGKLTAIVDWTSASFGPAEVDVAHMRTNLALSFSLEVADEFLDAYRSEAAAPPHDPWWDLRMALDFIPDAPVAARPGAELRRLEEFLTRAVAELS